MWSAIFDVFFASAGVGAFGKSRRRRAQFSPVPRPQWWKWSAGLSVLSVPIPVVVGAAIVMRMSFTMGHDDFLFFIGLIFFVMAMFLMMFALGFFVGMVGVALSVAAERTEARWLVLAVGVFALLVGTMLFFVPLPLWGPVWLIVSGTSCCVLGVHAPIAGSTSSRM